MKEKKLNPVYARWEGHEKHVSKHIRFRPEYADLLSRVAEEKKMNFREVLEDALKKLYGEPEKGGC